MKTNSNKKKSKKLRIILLIMMGIIVLIICFIPIYNEVITPFEGYDLTILTNYENSSNSILCEKYYNFYNDIVCYKDYEDKYDIDFFYRKGEDCILPQITMVFNYYTMESYSLIVNPLEDFNQVNEDNLATLKFVSTPIGYTYDESVVYIDSVQFNDWIFKELYYKTDDIFPEDLYRKDMRKPSYWYSFNTKTKEIVFSILEPEASLDLYSSEEVLIKYLKKNLYN